MVVRTPASLLSASGAGAQLRDIFSSTCAGLDWIPLRSRVHSQHRLRAGRVGAILQACASQIQQRACGGAASRPYPRCERHVTTCATAQVNALQQSCGTLALLCRHDVRSEAAGAHGPVHAYRAHGHRHARALCSAAASPETAWRRMPQSAPARSSDASVNPSPAPDVPPVTQADLDRLVTFLQEHRNVLVITGAGCSTESNIPDYRGPQGAYTSGFKPMFHQQVCTLWQTLKFANSIMTHAAAHWPSHAMSVSCPSSGPS